MYLFEFIDCSYGLLSFSNVMLGDTIDEASKRLASLYDDVDEKFSRLVPTIKGKLDPFDDAYAMNENIEITGNPIYSMELRMNFNHFPYSSFGILEGMEHHIIEQKQMEVLKKAEWKENNPDALYRIERRVHMVSLLCDYRSFVGITDSDVSVIGIKIAFPTHNMKEETLDSVIGTYTSVNRLLRDYKKNVELLRNRDDHTIIFPH